MAPYKLGRPDPALLADPAVVDPFVEHHHGHVWQSEQTTGPARLAIAPASGHVNLLADLAAVLHPPFWVLYILLATRTGRPEGRYQSETPLTRFELDRLLSDYRDYLEQDGRHHLWIHSPADNATLVYDQHDVLYAYGPLDRYGEVLARHNLRQGEVRLPVPHVHRFNPDFDPAESTLLTSRAWRRTPLTPDDQR